MTTQQPEALRLADIVERLNVGVHSQAIAEEYTAAARELRRLHAENEALKQQIAATQPAAQGMDAQDLDAWKCEKCNGTGIHTFDGYGDSPRGQYPITEREECDECNATGWCGPDAALAAQAKQGEAMTHHTDVELLPCPFCGGKAEAKKPDMSYEFTLIKCQECDAQTDEGVDFEDAAEAWNRRTPAPQALRVPLTYTQINSILHSVPDDDDDAEWMLTDAQLLKIIRAAEAAHGIK